ncbi:hypothetical protein XELAEV_18045219mg [Xenopus laevis]|uniref:Uncharacterized protein n=1 Tax=Xenopus laevis TaxID=8355 RepID=A0A974C0A0_XENLA|nr:hypothetical protein XELAEV_18045219mg [Xenopus laevis]
MLISLQEPMSLRNQVVSLEKEKPSEDPTCCQQLGTQGHHFKTQQWVSCSTPNNSVNEYRLLHMLILHL